MTRPAPMTLPDLAVAVRQDIDLADSTVISESVNPITATLAGLTREKGTVLGWLTERIPDPYADAPAAGADPAEVRAPVLRSRSRQAVAWILRQALDDGILTTTGDNLDGHVSAWLIAVGGKPGQTFREAVAAADGLLDPRSRLSLSERLQRVADRQGEIDQLDILQALDALTAVAELLAKQVTLTRAPDGGTRLDAMDGHPVAGSAFPEMVGLLSYARFEMVCFVARQAHAVEMAGGDAVVVNLELVDLWARFASSLAGTDPVESRL